jgi:hypothetical protein
MPISNCREERRPTPGNRADETGCFAPGSPLIFVALGVNSYEYHSTTLGRPDWWPHRCICERIRSYAYGSEPAKT